MPSRRSGGAITWLLVAALVALAAAGSQSITAATPAATDRIETGGEAVGEATGLWIVQLADASLAAYEGGVQGLAPTSPAVTGARQLDVGAQASQAYLEYLESKHAQFQNRMEAALGRSVEVQFRYLNVLNAFAAKLSAEEAAALESLPEVRGVHRDTVRYLDTDVSHDLIRSASIWDGQTGGGLATRGEGVIVGMIDTGVNPFHPSFAAEDGDGYVHTNPFGSGNFTGVCDPAHPQHDPICNDKLIGAWNFHPSSPNARDVDGHGSHVGGTIAGNVHDANVLVGNDVHVRRIQGVAPRANVISYLVCFPSCPQSSSIAAVNQAITDGTNVLNYSISGVDNPWQDLVDLAFLDAFQAGIYISASAGNSGPGASTVAKTGPWNASVAASTHERVIANTVDATDPGPVPAELEGMAAVPGSGPPVTADIEAVIRFAGLVSPGNELGCNAFPGGSFTGTIALIQRGTCTFATKVVNAANAGAIAVIVFNNVGGPPITMGALEATSIPAVFLDLENGSDLRDFIVDNAPDPTEARINESTSLIINPDWEDIMAGFSSRGPSQFEMLAPTFTAPGVNILAAGPGGTGQPDEYAFQQGTSMSSPHGAGAGALLMALRPHWRPSEIRSALASTAVTEGILKEDGATPADPFDMGSGRIDLDRAGRIGLVLNETHANFVAANPATGGDPKTLNLPAMVSRDCVGTCTWTRTVQLTVDQPVTFNAVVTAPAGMDITVNPSTFTLAPGGQNGSASRRAVTITADVTGLPVDAWAFADVRFETTAHHDVYGDFVELARVPGDNTSYIERTVDLSAYSGQEICLAFAYKGFDAHDWRIDDVAVASDSGTHLTESFDDTEFPPTGWTRFNLDGAGSQWARTTTNPNTGVGAAVHAFSTTGGAAAMQNGWLVTPSFTPGDNAELTFFDRISFTAWFTYSGVWVSTGSCDPTPSAGPAIAASHYPVAVIPRAVEPAITVDPAELGSAQGVDEVVQKTLTIGNEGGVDLEWEFVEDGPERLPLRSATPVETAGEPGPTRLRGNALSGSGLEQGVRATPEARPAAAGTVTLTHSASQTVVAGNSVACSPDSGVTTHANQFLRTFTLADFGVTNDLDVTEVSFGIENLTGPGQTLTVNLYTLDQMPFTYANMTLIGTASQHFASQSLTIVTVPVTGTAPGGSTLVVEIAAPASGGVSGFWPGSNSAGQTAPSYIASSACGLANPTNLAAIGFGGVHLVMNVTGTTELPPCDAPDGTPWVDATPTSGTVTPGNDQEVTVTFDSTGLSPGTYTARFCVASNDPERPIVAVPVTLEVVEFPAIHVDPAALTQKQPAGTTRTQTLDITNTGDGTLEWTIAEADPLPAAAGREASLQRLKPSTVPRPSQLQRDYEAVPAADVILDGGFEAGTPNPFWDEGSTNFGTPLCTVALCGGPAPRTGSWHAWFGGTSAAETGFLRQSVVLEPGTAELRFWLLIGLAAGGAGNMSVSIDGTQVFQVTQADAASYTSYTEVVVDVSAHTGGTRLVSFDSVKPAGPTINFFVDDVSLHNEPAAPTACDTTTNVPWLSVSPASGSTPGGETDQVTVTFDTTGLASGSTHEAVLCVSSNDASNPVVEVPVTLDVGVTAPTALDFSGNDATDPALYRPSTRQWLVSGMAPVTWGVPGDIPVPADYSGDGTTDIAVFRPSNGTWFVRDGARITWGQNGDVPVPGHYRGREEADLAVFRPSTGTWWIRGVGSIAWGQDGDVAVPGDYNGDGFTDVAVFRPSTNTWWIRGMGAIAWGAAGDVPVAADFNGDGVTDIAVWRPSTRTWWVRGVSTGAWGLAGDIPVPGDYNGDGSTQRAVFRPSTGGWWMQGHPTSTFGTATDHVLALPHSVRSVYFP